MRTLRYLIYGLVLTEEDGEDLTNRIKESAEDVNLKLYLKQIPFPIYISNTFRPYTDIYHYALFVKYSKGLLKRRSYSLYKEPFQTITEKDSDNFQEFDDRAKAIAVSIAEDLEEKTGREVTIAGKEKDIIKRGISDFDNVLERVKKGERSIIQIGEGAFMCLK